MLCCGLLTLLAAGILAAGRWLRAMPTAGLITAGVLVIGSPAVALSLADSPSLDRADVIERAMQTLCSHR